MNVLLKREGTCQEAMAEASAVTGRWWKVLGWKVLGWKVLLPKRAGWKVLGWKVWQRQVRVKAAAGAICICHVMMRWCLWFEFPSGKPSYRYLRQTQLLAETY